MSPKKEYTLFALSWSETLQVSVKQVRKSDVDIDVKYLHFKKHGLNVEQIHCAMYIITIVIYAEKTEISYIYLETEL